MSENIKYYSEIEKYEIININDGDKFNSLGSNDIIVDENGNFKLLILSTNKSHFSFLGKNQFIEIPWEYVKKIGARTIIIDADESELNKFK